MNPIAFPSLLLGLPHGTLPFFVCGTQAFPVVHFGVPVISTVACGGSVKLAANLRCLVWNYSIFVTKDQSAQKYRASTTVGKVTEMVWQEHTGVLEPTRSKKSPSETVILLDYRTYLLSIPCHTMLQMRNLIDPHVMHPCEQVSRILSRKTDRIAGGGGATD